MMNSVSHKKTFAFVLCAAALLSNACVPEQIDEPTSQQQALNTPIGITPIEPEFCRHLPCQLHCDMTLPSPGTPGYCCDDGVQSTCRSSGYYDGGRRDPDIDNDGVPNQQDNCWLTPNPSQANADHDLHGDACDNCPTVPNDHQYDNSPQNGVGDACEDQDNDTIPNGLDNCPNVSNTNQADTDNDGVGDQCDGCPTTWNPSQIDSEPGGGQDACEPVTHYVWRGFDHQWGYNHRVRKLGNVLNGATGVVTHTADAGTGKDIATWKTHADRINTGYARFYQNSATIKMIGVEGNTYGITRRVHLPASSGHLDRKHNIVLLNGFEIIESRSPDAVKKFDKFDIELKDYSNGSFTVALDYAMKCVTPECWLAPTDYEYDIVVHYVVISSEEGVAISDLNTISNSYNWDGPVDATAGLLANLNDFQEIFIGEQRQQVNHTGASGQYQNAIVGVRGFSLDMNQEFHTLRLAMRAINPQYDPNTATLQAVADLFFKNWRTGMSNVNSSTTTNGFSFGMRGSTTNSLKLSMIQFRQAQVEPFIASGSFDTNTDITGSQDLNTLTPRCAGSITWSGPVAPQVIFDTANCFVANFDPAMVPGSGYTWQNGWYYRVNLNMSATCPLDNAQPWGANGDECYAGQPPAGKQAFIFDDNFYFTP